MQYASLTLGGMDAPGGAGRHQFICNRKVQNSKRYSRLEL